LTGGRNALSLDPICKQEASAEPLAQVFQHDQPKRKECIGFVPGRTSGTAFLSNLSPTSLQPAKCSLVLQGAMLLTTVLHAHSNLCAHVVALSRMKLTLKHNEESRGLKQHERIKFISGILCSHANHGKPGHKSPNQKEAS
jgi:hypothetical protein